MPNNNNQQNANQQNGNAEAANYEPSRNVKQSYLLLRNNGYSIANRLKLPGLFSYSPDNDKLKFCLASLFELILASILGWLVSDRFEFSLPLIFGTAFIIISMDYIACYLHQLVVIKKRQKLKNQKTLKSISTHDNAGGYKTYIDALDANFPDPKYKHYLFIAFIILMVSIRLYYFYDIADGSFIFDEIKQKSGTGAMALQGLILTMHLFIVWVHTTSTGYYLAFLFHIYWYKKPDENVFFRPLLDAPNFPYSVVTRAISLSSFITELQQDHYPDCQHLVQFNQADIDQYKTDGFRTDVDIMQGHHTPYHPHSLLKGATNDTCIIQTRGFLDDTNLISMINAQTNPIAKYAIAIHGLDLQLDSLELDRVG